MVDDSNTYICDLNIPCDESPYCDYGIDCFSGREYFNCTYPDNPFFDFSLLEDK